MEDDPAYIWVINNAVQTDPPSKPESMNSNLLIVGNFNRNSVIEDRYTYSSWPKIPVNPQLPANIDAVVMIAGSVSPVTAKELIEICNQSNVPFAYTDPQLNDLEHKLANAQKKIEEALDEEAANNQVEVTNEVKESKMATKKNAQKRAARKSSKKTVRNAEAKIETPAIVSNTENKQPTTPSNTIETNKESVAMNPTPSTPNVSSSQNSFTINMLPGETQAQALLRTLKDTGGALPSAVAKEDGRKTGKNTQQRMLKADFVRKLFKDNPGMKTENVQELIVKEFGRGFTPSEIHKIRREFGVEYAGRGVLRNISDKTVATPPVPTETPRQAPPTVMNDPRGSIEIGSPPDERVYAAIENLRTELGLVSLHVDENGIDYVAQVRGHINHH